MKRTLVLVLIIVAAIRNGFAIIPDPTDPPFYVIQNSQMPTGRFHALNRSRNLDASATLTRNDVAEEYQVLQLVIKDPDENEFVIDSGAVLIPEAP